MNAHPQSTAEAPERRPADYAQGIDFGMLLASASAARSAIGSVHSAFTFILLAVHGGAGSDLDINSLRTLSEDLSRLAAEADAMRKFIADHLRQKP